MDRMGMQMMLVPLGCPYDAAARVLKGKDLENSLPEDATAAARKDPDVAVAAPVLAVAVPRPKEGRTDMWVGLDQTALSLKPWWHAASGAAWFQHEDGVILGAEAAAAEMRAPGDLLYSPETGKTLHVDGVLARSGTSDDSLFFVPLKTLQSMFGQAGKITAVDIRLRDPSHVREASERLQQVRGAQVVTLTEMMGTFLNLVGAVRVLLLGIACVALVAAGLMVFNTLLSAVLERTGELAIMRAIGASRLQLFALVEIEAVLLTTVGSAVGVVAGALLGSGIEGLVRRFVPLAPNGSLVDLTPAIIGTCLALGVGMGLIASVYPAWQASRLEPALAMRLE